MSTLIRVLKGKNRLISVHGCIQKGVGTLHFLCLGTQMLCVCATALQRLNHLLSPLRQAKDPELSLIARQKLTRLKVNRTAIVQSLRVEHVLDYLVESGVFSEEDKGLILSSGSTQAKTRKLLDLLPGRDNNIDWYKHFRSVANKHDINEMLQVLHTYLILS